MKTRKGRKTRKKNQEEGSEESGRTPFDGLLKHLADEYAVEVMTDLAGLKGIVSHKSMGGEVEITHRLSDRVWRVVQIEDGEKNEFLFHLEFESSSVVNIDRRLGMYGWGLYEKEGLPVYHLVWYVGDERPSGWPEQTWRRECTKDMVVGKKVVSTMVWWEVWLPGGHEAESFLREAPTYLLPFATLMPGMKKSLLYELKEQIMNAPISEGQKQDLLVMVVFFASRILGIERTMEVIQMNIFEHNPMAEYLIQQGIEQGIEQGISLLQMQARKRFPHTSEATLELMRGLRGDALQKVSEMLLDAPDGRAFRHLLLQLKQQSTEKES